LRRGPDQAQGSRTYYWDVARDKKKPICGEQQRSAVLQRGDEVGSVKRKRAKWVGINGGSPGHSTNGKRSFGVLSEECHPKIKEGKKKPSTWGEGKERRGTLGAVSGG